MPTLNWIGKEKVINHHLDVPFRTLVPSYSFGDEESAKDNLIIHGDNLEALKAILPQYEGKVKLIYIDPPYNTGNEGWVYNDNVNDPKIKKWLGEVVGKEGEDLSRHDKWLCMMYPRLKLLHKLLRDDGAIFISIDDVEQANLKLICDEIFGRSCFMTDIAWRCSDNSNNNALTFSEDYNHTLVYSKKSTWKPFFQNDLSKRAHFKNPDNDPRGPWFDGNPVNNPALRVNLQYDITTPNGNLIKHPPNGWRWEYDTILEKISTGEIRFSEDQTRIIRRTYLNEMEGLPPSNLWIDLDVTSHNRRAKYDLKSIFPELPVTNLFSTPKPERFIQQILRIASDSDSIILDSFAGSGTTAHAVLKLNQEDGGNRKFIMIEMEDYAESITAERVRRVIQGYGPEGKEVPGTGGGFSYLTLGPTIFTPEGALNPEVDDNALRQYIWYAETRTARPSKKLKNKFHLGSALGVSYYFFYIMGEETILDFDFIKTIKDQDEQYVIYADSCSIDSEYLKSRNITFKKIPRDIPRH